MLLAMISFSVFATEKQTVPIVWPFAIGSQQANFIRLIIAEANIQQDKYNFIFENKPGAGGTIAANYVSNYKGIALLSSSSSFFVRPQFYPDQSYRVEDFRPVLIECTGQPYIITSAKYKTINDLRKQKRLSIGMIQGSLTEALARQLQLALPNTELIFIGYQGTLQPTLDVIGGNLDLNVDLPAFLQQYIVDGKLNAIGSSGSGNHSYFSSFNSAGISGFENLVSNYQIVARSDIDPTIIEELHNILRKAANSSQGLPGAYASDLCIPANLDMEHTNATYKKWTMYWANKLQFLKK